MALTYLLAAAAISPSAPSIVIPPPATQSILTWEASQARCEDGTLDMARLERPEVQLVWGAQGANEKPVTYRFRIDEDGRVLGIETGNSAQRYQLQRIGPALAVSRFSAGKARSGCSVVFTPERRSIADAAEADVIDYSVFPEGRPPRAIFDRLKPQGSTCFTPPPAVLLRAYPDFSTVAASPGKTEWSMVRFDIDASGKPVRVGIHATTGSAALNDAAVEAVAKSRFAKGEKTGCLYPYWLRGKKLPAPEIPSAEAFRPSDATCPAELKWDSKPVMQYPENYRRRSVEGWAVVAFDVAPWGGTGNIRVLTAEPAAEFGQAAVQLISAAKLAEPKSGYTGCVERIFYRMSDKPAPATADVPPPPY